MRPSSSCGANANWADRASVKRLASASVSWRALTGELEAARALLDTTDVSYDAWEALFWLGHWQECAALATQRIAASRRGGDRAFAFEATYDLARVRWVEGKAASAGQLLEQALEVAVDGGERGYELAVRCLLVQVSVETHQLAAARAHLDRAHTIAAGSDQWRGLAGQVALADGTAALADHSPKIAERHFKQASAIFRRVGCPWGEAEANLLWARGLRGPGDTASAERRLRTARICIAVLRLHSVAGRVAPAAPSGAEHGTRRSVGPRDGRAATLGSGSDQPSDRGCACHQFEHGCQPREPHLRQNRGREPRGSDQLCAPHGRRVAPSALADLTDSCESAVTGLPPRGGNHLF